VPAKKSRDFQVAWTTVTYRSVILAVLVCLMAVAMASYFIFPTPTQNAINRTSGYFDHLMNKVFGTGASEDSSQQPQAQQAHFTDIDGTVRVKKANSNTWVRADYGLPLEKGDVVQTMSEGIAKVAFVDGSTYSIQQDSLITIEEITSNALQQGQYGVRLETGTFQLNTGDVPSIQQVRIDNSTTTVNKNSALQASNDRKNDKHEVLLTKGSGTFEINGQTTTVAPYEKVVFNPVTGSVSKEKEIAPPVLLAPANMMPIFSQPGKSLEFSWTPVDGVHWYHIKVSRNPYFSTVEKEARVLTSDWRVSGLGEGRYYWMVQSVDPRGRESVESEKNGFTIIHRGDEKASLALELEPFVQHGHVIEVKGKTQQGARVMVNGQQVPVIDDDGKFNYFTPALPTGESIITITAQNEKGGVATQTKKVVIQ
jgi:hypothetical protein